MSRLTLSLQELQQATALPETPLSVELPGVNKRRVQIDAWLRVLPRRRWVAKARYQEAPVLLKLFAGSDARRRQQRDIRGTGWLHQAGVLTPALNEADSAQQGAFILYEWLSGTRPVDAENQEQMQQVARLLGRMHRAAITQSDMHLGNFLESDGRLFAVDGDGIRQLGHWRRRAQELKSLAILAAQRAPAYDRELTVLLGAYLQSRTDNPGPGNNKALTQRFERTVIRERRKRMHRYLRKTERACTEFLQQRNAGRHILAVRDQVDPVLLKIAQNPEHYLNQGTVLKAGNTATVVRINVEPDPSLPLAGKAGMRSLVLKRYNIKSAVHRWRISLKPRSRGRTAWRNGQLLTFLGIPTARPLMLVEQRRGLMRDTVYLLMEDKGDLQLDNAVMADGPRKAWCETIASHFEALQRAGLVHGDTKASNFLVQDDHVFLVDLDALSASHNKRGFLKDHKRFLANWAPDSRAREAFAQALMRC